MGNSERIVFRGDTGTSEEITQSGDAVTLSGGDLDPSAGTITAVAITEDGTETTISSQDYDFSGEVEFEEGTDADGNDIITVTSTDMGIGGTMTVQPDGADEEIDSEGGSVEIDGSSDKTITVVDSTGIEVASYEYTTG